MLNKFIHETVLDLAEITDRLLIDEISEMEDDQSAGSDIENEIYALFHYGSSKSHLAMHLKKLQPITQTRYFQSNTTCYRCHQTGHLARDCSVIMHACFLCGKPGHKKPQCPSYMCRVCRQKGHSEINCPEKSNSSYSRPGKEITSQKQNACSVEKNKKSDPLPSEKRKPFGSDVKKPKEEPKKKKKETVKETDGKKDGKKLQKEEDLKKGSKKKSREK